MSEANQVSPGRGVKPPPNTVIGQMLSTLEAGEAEDQHCLSHECDVILECKICRNLFRVMNSFLNHKKVHCLQYVVSFTVPLPVSKTSEEKTDKDTSTTINTEKAEAVSVKDLQKDSPKDLQKDSPKDLQKDSPKDLQKDSPKDLQKDSPKDSSKDLQKGSLKDLQKGSLKDLQKDSQKDLQKDSQKDLQKDPQKDSLKDPKKTDQTKKSVAPVKSPMKSKEAEKESVSDKNQTKPPTTTVKVTASVESTDKMKLRSPRKTDSSISKKEEVKKEVSTPKKGESSVQKKDSSQPKKGDSSGQKQGESTSKKEEKGQKKDVALQKRGEASSHKKNDVSSTPKKNDISSQKREERSSRRGSSSRESSSRESSSQRKEESSVSSKKDRKEDASVKKGDSSSHKKDDSTRRGSHKKEDSSIPFRIDKERKGDKESSKKEDTSAPLKKGDKNNSSQKKEESSTRSKRGDSSSQKKEDTSTAPKKVDSSSTSKKEESSVQKKETASAAKQVDGANQKKAEAPPPSKKQRTEEPGHSTTKKPAEEPKEKLVPAPTKTATTTVTPASPTAKTKTTTVTTASPTSKTKTTAVTPASPTSKSKTTAVTPVSPTSKTKTTAVTPASPVAKTKTTAVTPASPAAKTKTTAVTPISPTAKSKTTAVTPVSPTAKSKTTAVTPVSPTAKSKTTAVTPASPTAKTKTTTVTPASPTTKTTVTPTPKTTTPAATLAPSTTTTPASVDKKVDAQADQNKQPVLKKPEPISAENKADEPPILTPEKVSPSEPMEIPNQKQADASDTLNPLIAGVLDAYQRYKDKNQELNENVEKPKSNEVPTTNAKSAAAEGAPMDLPLAELPDADKNDIENKKDKAGDASAALDDKVKIMNEDDLENEGYELRNRLRCPDCDLELTTMSKLAQHMSKHLADAKGHFVCPICQKETRLASFSELILHLRDPHFLKDKQLLPMWRNLMKNCWIDEKDMSATFPVIEAVKRSERGKDNELPEKNYKCPYCKKKPKILRYFSGLIGHLRSEHGLKRCQLQKMQAKLRKTSVVEVKHKKIKKKCLLFKCSFCFKTFTKKSSIKLHVKTCRKRTESTVKDKTSKKRRGRPKTFTKIVAFKTVGKKKSITDNSVTLPTAAAEEPSERSERPSLAAQLVGDQLISTAVNTPRLPALPFSASNRDGNPDQNYAFAPVTNLVQPVKLETFWVSKAPGKPSECIKSTITNLEKLRTTPSKMFKSSELSKIGNFQCYSCNRYYSFRQHFERHVQLCNHNRKIEEISDFQTLRCLECNQSFSYLQHLKRHAAKHLGLDRFKCKLCNYSSYYWSDTKYHLASHKGVQLKHPEYYIQNVSCSENVALKPENPNEWSPATPRTVMKRVAEASPLVATATTGTGPGVVKTLVLTEQDGMLKVVSDPNQIAKMVNKQGSPPLKRLRISADASQAPAIIKALPDIQKAVLSPGVKVEKRESTLMPGNLPSPTLSDPTPTTEAFEPAVDPDKEHISWVRKPLKDPDAQPFKWDDEDEGDDDGSGNYTMVSSASIATSPAAPSSATTNINVQSSSAGNEKPLRVKRLASDESSNTKSICETESKFTILADKPVPENFSEPPILTKEVPIVKSTVEKDDLQMPLISASNVAVSDASTSSQESVVTFMFNDNNELLMMPTEASSNVGGAPHGSTQQLTVSGKDFFCVPHPLSSSPSSSVSTSTSTSTTMLPFGSPISPAKVTMMNKPKTYWDLQHKNTLRRLPNRGLVSTSNLSFPSASRRVTKTPNAPPVTPTAISSATSTPPQIPTAAPSSLSLSSPTGSSEK